MFASTHHLSISWATLPSPHPSHLLMWTTPLPPINVDTSSVAATPVKHRYFLQCCICQEVLFCAAIMSTVTLSQDWPHIPFTSQKNITLLQKLRQLSNTKCYNKASSLLWCDVTVSYVLKDCGGQAVQENWGTIKPSGTNHPTTQHLIQEDLNLHTTTLTTSNLSFKMQFLWIPNIVTYNTGSSSY